MSIVIDLYYWGTVNGHKITMYLEECGVDYRLVPVKLKQGEQFKASFLKISPNNKMPAIIDHKPADGGEPVSIFESGAILLYLAEKTGRGLPTNLRPRKTAIEWLMWQMAGLGPMAGQYDHFKNMAREEIGPAIERYRNETERLLSVLDRHLEGRDHIAGEYSIADMACYPWIKVFITSDLPFGTGKNLGHWCARIAARNSTIRAYAHAETYKRDPAMNDEEHHTMFAQSVENVRRMSEVRASQ